MKNNLDKIKIGRALVSDSKEILKLLNSSQNLLGYKGEKFTLNEVKDYIKEKINQVIIYKVDNKIVGVFIANFWKDYCYLYLFVVDKNYRHLGVGENMMDYLEKNAKKEGYIGLITKKGDIDMINLIKKRGYLKGDKFIYFHKNLK
jgi:N-acetylglutamate synthase-like GNAT family acetyltransferase